MPEVFISSRPCTPADLMGDDSPSTDAFCDRYRVHRHTRLPPARAYSTDAFDSIANAVVTRLNALPTSVRQNLGSCVDVLGDAPTRQLAEFHYRHLEQPLMHATGLVGAGATAMGARSDSFRGALAAYQDALVDLYEHRRGQGQTGFNRPQLEARARQTYANLDRQFRVEVDRIVPAVDRGKNRGTPLTSADRGITLARQGGRRRINVQNVVEASRVGRLGQAITHVGRGAVALDIGLRYRRVRGAYQSDADWLRQASQEMTGFGFAGIAGYGVGKGTVIAAGSGLALLGISVTPVGWVLLLGAGATAGLAAGWGGDRFGRWLSGSIWSRGRE